MDRRLCGRPSFSIMVIGLPKGFQVFKGLETKRSTIPIPITLVADVIKAPLNKSKEEGVLKEFEIGETNVNSLAICR